MGLILGDNVISEWFVAKITEVGTAGAAPDDGVPHAWIALEPSPELSKMVEDQYAAKLAGTLEDSPAFSLNGSPVSVGTVVMMRRRGASNKHNNAMEFVGGGGGGAENCPRVSLVGCTAGIMMVGYQLNCEEVNEPVQGPPAGGPVGTIAMWGVATLPNGWLECNGSEFDPLTFPELFDVLGGRYVPDLRNQFVRGKGDKTGALLSKKQWTTGMPRIPFVAAAGGGTVGSQLPLVSGPGAGGYTESSKHTHTITGGDSETAPDHIVLLYMIKAKL